MEVMARAPLPPSLPFGEIISIDKKTLRRERKAIRGFVLPTHDKRTPKLRRKNRDTANRKRRVRRTSRTSRRAAVRNTKHWSEKRDLRIRNTAFGHKKYWYARLVSAKLHRRAATRLAARAVQSSVSTRRTAFTVRLAQLSVPFAGSETATAPSAETLVNSGAFSRKSCALQLEQRSDFDALRARSAKFKERVPRILKFNAFLAEQREKMIHSIPARLVATASNFAAVTPM